MGVRGLEKFIEKIRCSKMVDIKWKILLWKLHNPNQKPIIVFDILGFRYMDHALLFGGSSNDFDQKVENFFIGLTRAGAKLVFIQDLAIEIAKTDLWIERRNKDFQLYQKIYEDIGNRKSVSDVLSRFKENGGSKISSNLTSIASKYGEYVFARPGRECDIEVAAYAKKHNAMAVISSDTDFLIFEGNWKFWNYKDLDLVNFSANEFDRLAFTRMLSINDQQRPLLATLIGNDITKHYSDELNQFHCRLGRPSERFENVADYIGRKIKNEYISEDDIDVIATDIFGSRAGDAERQLIQNSLSSYDLHSQVDENRGVDPIEAKLANVKAVKCYRRFTMNTILPCSVQFNDMATEGSSSILSEFLNELSRKKMGIRFHDAASEKTFEIIRKKSRAESFAVYRETPIAPECPMPPLIDLLTKDDSDDELNETRWDLLAWMLSISKKQRDALRAMDKELRIPCASLLALVQRNILSIKAADGILITEMVHRKSQEPELAKKMPLYLEPNYVRAAHIYRTVYSNISYGFIMVGLNTAVSDLLKFDGVYYQNLMAVKVFPEDLFKSIKPYRIYTD